MGDSAFNVEKASILWVVILSSMVAAREETRGKVWGSEFRVQGCLQAGGEKWMTG